MNQGLKNEIDSCISELNSIVHQLRSVSVDIAKNISGMNTRKYTRELENSADKYQKAIGKLYRIK